VRPLPRNHLGSLTQTSSYRALSGSSLGYGQISRLAVTTTLYQLARSAFPSPLYVMNERESPRGEDTVATARRSALKRLAARSILLGPR